MGIAMGMIGFAELIWLVGYRHRDMDNHRHSGMLGVVKRRK